MPADDPPLSFNAWLRWDVVDRQLRRLSIQSVLEVGAGQGGFGARFARRWTYVGIERDPTSARVATARVAPLGGTILNGTTALLAPDASFDLVCAFEVLEHIEDDAAALGDWASRVREGGWLMLSVPAHQRRMGAADVAVGHYRRYERPQLRDLLAAAGLRDVTIETYGFPLGYVLEAGRNLLVSRTPKPDAMELRTGASGRLLQPRGRLGLVTRFGAAPFQLLQRPFAKTEVGTGFVAIARRRS